ncbi:MAG: tRNA-2-methylthio-N6-dimethylallyladenosine synthase [Deferribacteres bacterium]|jgi:tRNA-2-methylthio-N6-dimethylallyladenosine synthase|nr:tRNA-2-methylthio-N6-dimethylallyladenosine synthase [Deferribacteres bacterium]
MGKVYIRTFGCQMNTYDSERIASIFNEMGFSYTENPEEADFAVINTCSVREKPQQKVKSEIGRLKRVNGIKIGVCGCVAQQEGEKFLDNFKDVSFVFGTDAIGRLYEIIDLVQKGQRVCDTSTNEGEISIPSFSRETSVSAFVTIMKGCDNFCSYCIVPYVRGREKSRKAEEIIREINYLVENGVREITLLGQNVNSYGKNLDENINFPKLLYMVNDIKEVKRIRFVTSHPKDFSDELIEAMIENEKVMPYLHLPLQAGSDNILKKMNRKYSYGEYLEKVAKAKERIPGLALSSDFIVGFPGETDADFEDTLRAIEEIEYETIFAFKYSPRPKTKAFNLEDNIPDDIKSSRLDALLKKQEKITRKLMKKYLGQICEVLVEGMSKKDDSIYSGRNPQNRIVNFKSDKNIKTGDLVSVKIMEAKKNSLFGLCV